jgi:hypothetical protein
MVNIQKSKWCFDGLEKLNIKKRISLVLFAMKNKLIDL